VRYKPHLQFSAFPAKVNLLGFSVFP
jgi:hypothetical protein